MRFIRYIEVESYCISLAAQIRNYLGAQLSTSKFIAIPRGGLVILGILSYVLQLDHHQLRHSESAESDLLVVVDDCSLSGARFAAFLDTLAAKRVIFAHLVSHPRLRQSILEHEPRVEACFAALDLNDDGTQPSPEIIARWEQNLGGRYFWAGGIEPIAFAWTQPNRTLWNASEHKLEDNWFWASPRQCLKVRMALGIPLADHTPGPITIPNHIHWRTENEEIILWHAHDDRIYGLKGIAGLMWRALVAFGNLQDAVEYILNQYEVDEERLYQDLKEFAKKLTDRGLIEGLDEASEFRER